MTELELYKFVTDNRVEYRWENNEGERDVIMLPNFDEISDFNKILGHHISSEDGINCVMKDGYFAFWMQDICEYFAIELDKVFGLDPHE